MIRVGDIVKTNYGTGPFVVRRIHRHDCGAVSLVVRPHPNDDGGDYYLNRYDPKSMRSTRSDDRLELLGHATGVQQELGL